MNINEVNTTNLRIIVGISLEFIYGLCLTVGMMSTVKVDIEVAKLLGLFIFGVLGLGITQFGIKRKTFKPEVHEKPTETQAVKQDEPIEPDKPYTATDG